MNIFGKKEINQEQKPKKEQDKSNILKPIIIGITALVLIVLIGLLTKNTLLVIIVAIVVQIIFIIYLARILEKEYEIKLRHLKKKEEIKSALLSTGWSDEQIEKAFSEIEIAKAGKIV